MSMSFDDIRERMSRSGILGVISNTISANVSDAPLPADEPRAEAPQAVLEEQGQLIVGYASQLGFDLSVADLNEALIRFGQTPGEALNPETLAAVLGTYDISAEVLRHDALEADLWPALAQMYDGQFVLVLKQGDHGLTIYDPTLPERESDVPFDEFRPYWQGITLRGNATMDRLRKTHVKDMSRTHWFWGRFLKYRSILADIAVGSLVANVLAVSVALFSLQIYDRVIPHESTATLWVLAIGALIALCLEGLIKISRAKLMDGAGRAIELRVQDILMSRLMGMRSDKRPMPPSGIFAAMREFGSVREFFTASTVGALADIPFVLVFLVLVASIGGPIVWVLIAGGLLMVLPGYFLQKKMVRLTQEAQGASARSSRLLHEAIFELDTLKAQRGEDRFARIFAELNGLSAVTSSEQRKIASALTFWSQGVQQATYVTAAIMGTFMVFAGEFTVGSIIAVGILTGRTLAPLTQLAGIMARWSNVQTALEGLSKIESAEQDLDEARSYLRREKVDGAFEMRNVTFRYEDDGPPTLDIAELALEPGQHAAILGTNGSGKSTLLKMLSGLYAPTEGRVLIDGVDMAQIEPRDLRRQVGYLSQDVRLFSGTLRDNLNLNMLESDDERLMQALEFAGLGPFVRAHHKGLDLEIRDGGEGMSIGQRQSIGWARIWLQDPKVVLLDEPTAALDQTLEAALIRRLQRWLEGRTAIIATHRVPILQLTNRTFILQSGRLAVDGPRDEVLAHITRRNEG